jgi:hypothetical protein
MISVDLRTKVLPTGHRVYMIRPGVDYHLFGAFAENQAVAPDLADFEIPDGQRLTEVEDVNNQIKRARAIRQWASTEETRKLPQPSRLAADYAGLEQPTRIALYRNTADEILTRFSEGTLIYVPNPDLSKNAIFGELAGPREPRTRFPGMRHYSSFQYLGRPLRNIQFLPMRGLPTAYLDAMKRRVWTHEFGARDSELVYRQYYGDFEIVGQKAVTEITVTKEKVFAPDLSITGAVTNFVDQMLRRIEAGDASTLSLSDVVFLRPERDGPIIHANLGSEGEILVESARKHIPRFVKIIFVLAAVYTGHDIFDLVTGGGFGITNSLSLAGFGQEDMAETDALFYDFVNNTGRDNLQEIIDYVRETQARTGAEVNAHVAGQR